MSPPSRPSQGTQTPPQAGEALAVIERYREDVLSQLRAALAPYNGPPFNQMRYHLGWQDRQGQPIDARGGKLLRPALCLLSCEAVGGDPGSALPAAAAVELLHNFTLIHDDVEDASAERHGRETVWRLWGQAQAINAGDGMLALAHETLLGLEERGHPAERVLRAARMLDTATLRLCAGQHRDLVAGEQPHVSRDDYLTMVEGKTASLLAACCGIGALLGGANDETIRGLEEFGRRLGLAFQIRDDVLGIWGNAGETGKPAGDDLRAGKRSYPVVAALDGASADERQALQQLLNRSPTDDGAIAAARSLLERLGAREESERAAFEHAEAAIASLARLSLQTERRRELEQLARFVVERRA
jgi:geranylgeranyl diphosphate synthase type I